MSNRPDTIEVLHALCQYRAAKVQDYEYCECEICEAAFEIQYLREEVKLWQGIAERFAESDPRFEAFHAYFRQVFPE